MIIDPSILNEMELEEMILKFRIDLISHSDDEKIVTNLYYVLKKYFNEKTCSDIVNSIFSKEELDNLENDLFLIGIKNKDENEL
jgi:transcriptional regulator CtsR